MQTDRAAGFEPERDNLASMVEAASVKAATLHVNRAEGGATATDPLRGANKKHSRHQRISQFDGMLQDAHYLLNYAIEAGIEVEPDIAKRILAAIRMGRAAWDTPEAGELAAAITKLAAKLKPVTAETLRASREDADQAIRGYERIALCLALFVVPLSLISFISAGISNKISADIAAANEYLLTMHTQVDTLNLSSELTPPLVLGELQKFAIEMQSIYSHSKQLKWLSPFPEEFPCSIAAVSDDRPVSAQGEKNGCTLQLQLAKNLNTFSLLKNELEAKTTAYQTIRDYANSVTANVALVWGAIGNIILPVLYALLGACAAVLRAFTQQLTARTFAPTYATPARFYIAGIGGGVIGLFNNVFGQTLSVSPLAIAFLVGYAADIFFSFLEAATQNLGKTKLGS
jgi:hypothetical protein